MIISIMKHIIFRHFKQLPNSLASIRYQRFATAYKARTYSSRTCIDQNDFERYFEQKLPNIDQHAALIITELSKPTYKIQKLEVMLENYLDYYQKVRSIDGLMLLLTAFATVNVSEFQKHRRKLIEYLLRPDKVSQIKCDSRLFNNLVKQLLLRINESQQKIKSSYIKNKTAELILCNSNFINDGNIMQIIKFFTSINDRNMVSQSNRYLKIANLIHQKLWTLFNNQIAGDVVGKHKKQISCFELNELLSFFSMYPPEKQEYSRVLYLVVKRMLFQSSQAVNSFYIFYCHKNFPYIGRNQEGVYYKDLILKHIMDFPADRLIKKIQWHDLMIFYSMVSFQFYKFMNQVQFKYDGIFNYLQRQDLVQPTINDYFWQSYNNRTALIHSNNILKHIIKDVYPQKFITMTDAETKTITPTLNAQNQIKVRMEHALVRLGLKLEKQIQISGRFADFVVDGNIVIECDGDYHFNIHQMELDQSTQFRNTHLLLAGYRLILINIFEYNKHRDTESLSKILKQKLDCMYRNNAILVI